MRQNIEELLLQPFAQESLAQMGKLKSAAEYTEEEVKELEPLWKRAGQRRVRAHVVEGSRDVPDLPHELLRFKRGRNR